MDPKLQKSFSTGYERLSAWADLLDAINLFPVADRDTGRNLLVSLAPLHRIDSTLEEIVDRLLIGATGNSGNIAACFFAGFIEGDPCNDLLRAVRIGNSRAWQSIADPKPGTMLTVFDELLKHIENLVPQSRNDHYSELIDCIEKAVHSTSEILPRLKSAGVVDAGALGMFIFLEGFFISFMGKTNGFRSISATFENKIRLPTNYSAADGKGYCIDTLMKVAEDSKSSLSMLAAYGESIVVHQNEDNIKVHLHAKNHETVRQRLEELGTIVRWSAEDMGSRNQYPPAPSAQAAMHIVTDAAGSVTRDDAARLEMSLLDSYIVFKGTSLPETLCDPEQLYSLMRQGTRVSTAQASNFQRHQQYQSIISRYGSALYLCVGSVYTGNHQAAVNWKTGNDPRDQFHVIDTGLASGRLGIAAIATARYSCQADSGQAVVDYAREVIGRSEEFIFLDRLQYLVAGGRLSKAKGFFGDFFGVKPVISPTSVGVVKAGAVRNRNDQVAFALDKLEQDLRPDAESFIMLEYSDNRQWVEETVLCEITRRLPSAEIFLQPLSLTSGVHMGPGTWAVAYLPFQESPAER